MAVKPVPEGHHTVTPYLVVPGVAKLIDYLQRAFQAKELHRSARPDGTIMHAEVQIGDSRVMMGEPVGEFKAMPANVCLYVPNVDSTYTRALQAGGTSLREPADQFYGDRTAGVKDPCGNQWWIATHQEDVAPAELERRAQAATKKHSGE